MRQIHKLLISIILISMLTSTFTNAKENGNEPLSANRGLSSDQLQKVGAPYQVAIKKGIENGNLTPSIKPEYNIEVLENTRNHLKVKGTTKIQFNNPKEAGYENNKWPKFVIKDPKKNMIGKGIIKPGDYDQYVKDYLKSKILEIQNKTQRSLALSALNQSFESGQRNHIITETYERIYPENSSSTLSAITTNNDILMGFTKIGYASWIIEDRSEICIPFLGCFEIYYYKAGYELDGALGLRLPTEVALNLPNEMVSGQNYLLSTSIDGRNWDANKYSAVNVPAENGNEFVARLDFFIGVRVRLIQITVIDWTIDIDKDYGKSFKTPIGPNEEFPIPDLDLNPDETGLKFDILRPIAYLGIGLRINPDLGSDKITTDYSTTGDSTGSGGSGSARYSEPNIMVQFGPLQAGNYDPNTEYANIRLSNYKYYFDICRVGLDANIQFYVFSINAASSGYANIFTVDCSDFTGGLYLGTHEGTTADDVNGKVLVSSNVPSITNLRNVTYAPNYIKWSWIDPTDQNFTKVKVYINGKFKAEIPKGQQYYNTTELLVNQSYEISTHTVDIHGGINQTWKNNTAKTKNTRILYDDFDDNSTNTSKWIISTTGTGPTIKEINKRLEITLPDNSRQGITILDKLLNLFKLSSKDQSSENFGAGYVSTCKLRGDFDIEVDYQLLDWHRYNGARMGIDTDLGTIERSSFTTNDLPYGPNEVFVANFSIPYVKIIKLSNSNLPRKQLEDKLRLARWGNKIGGYYYVSGLIGEKYYSSGWQELEKNITSTMDTNIGLSTWSYDYTFSDRPVKIMFDNLYINYGQLICK